MIEEQEWEASEGAVISALRRLSPPGDHVFSEAREVLEASHINTRANMASIRLPHDPETQQRLPDLFEIVDPGQGEILRVISSDQGVKVILDEHNLSPVKQELGSIPTNDEKTGLTELSVHIPSEARETPGILALVCNKLALHGINVDETVDGVHQHILLVSSEDAIEAHRLLVQLTGDA